MHVCLADDYITNCSYKIMEQLQDNGVMAKTSTSTFWDRINYKNHFTGRQTLQSHYLQRKIISFHVSFGEIQLFVNWVIVTLLPKQVCSPSRSFAYLKRALI